MGKIQNFDIIDGYTPIILDQNKHRYTSKGRSSGSIVIWYKNSLADQVKLCKKTPNYIWIQISSLAICGIYIPAEQSNYFDENIFEDLSKDITEFTQESKLGCQLGESFLIPQLLRKTSQKM